MSFLQHLWHTQCGCYQGVTTLRLFTHSSLYFKISIALNRDKIEHCSGGFNFTDLSDYIFWFNFCLCKSRFECLRVSFTGQGFGLRPSQFSAIQLWGQWHLEKNCVVMSTQQTQPAACLRLIGTLTTVLGYSIARKCELMKDVVLQYICYMLMNHVSTTTPARSTL